MAQDNDDQMDWDDLICGNDAIPLEPPEEPEPLDPNIMRLAAHPLNSCNPPPPELPDLLDSLIASENRLKANISKCETIGRHLNERAEELRRRYHAAVTKLTRFKEQSSSANTTTDKKHARERIILEAEERVLKEMCLQILFVRQTFTGKIKGMAMSAIKAHQDIFGEFLGRKHDHPGIEVADSRSLSCTLYCAWYISVGPYEWSKQPYSDAWWDEMNHTDWDWPRIKEHMSDAVTVAGGRVQSLLETLHSNACRFIPFWIWATDYKSWALHTETRNVKNPQGKVEPTAIVKVRFTKTPAMIENEKTKELDEFREQHISRGIADNEVMDRMMQNLVVNVKSMGETVIDQEFVFNGQIHAAASGTQASSVRRWLSWYGYEKWREEVLRRVDDRSAKTAQE